MKKIIIAAMLSIMSLPAYATSLDADLSAAEDSAGKQVLMNAWTCAKLGKACAEFQKSNGTFTVQGFEIIKHQLNVIARSDEASAERREEARNLRDNLILNQNNYSTAK